MDEQSCFIQALTAVQLLLLQAKDPEVVAAGSRMLLWLGALRKQLCACLYVCVCVGGWVTSKLATGLHSTALSSSCVGFLPFAVPELVYPLRPRWV